MIKVPWSPPAIEKEEKEAAIRVINSGWLTQGKETQKFEEELADYISCKHVIVMNNGTSALIASLLAEGIGKGDEVLVPSLTFIASVNAITAVGATPVLVDSNLKTFNTTPELMQDKLTNKTKAILPVDVAGMPIDIDKIRKFADENNLKIIEDAAQGIGASYKGKKLGSFDHTTIFSFHMAKTITTIEGGCITTNDDEISKKCRMIRNHGMQATYNYGMHGLNFKTTDIQSAIGKEQLKKISKYLAVRNKIANIYTKELKNFGEFQHVPEYVTSHSRMLFGILVEKDKRDEINKKLNGNGIDTRICWPPAHKQNHHSKIFTNENLPNAEYISSKIINLPMGNGLTENSVNYVTEKFREICR